MDIQTINTDIQSFADEYANAKLAIDAAQDAALLASLNAQIAQLKADLADCMNVPPSPPPPTGFPDATNTGVPAGTTLTAYTGSRTITVAGTVIEGKRISGLLTIRAKNVTVRKCEILGEGIDTNDSAVSNFVVEDCDLKGNGSLTGIVGFGVTVRRCDISGFTNGCRLFGTFTVKGNYIHGPTTNGPDPHYDGLELWGACLNSVVEDNWIDFVDTSCIFVANLWGPINGLVINHNKLTGADMPCRTEGWKSNSPVTGVRWTNNVIQKGHWGYWDLERTSPGVSNKASQWDVTASGNVDDATGAPIN